MHIDEQAAELREEIYGNPEIDAFLKTLAELSGTPLTVDVTMPLHFYEDRNYKRVVVSKTTAEAMPFELLLEDGETSGVLAEKFIKKHDSYLKSFEYQNDNPVIPNRPSYEELNDAFSRVLSQETYVDFHEFMEKFNESGLESLEHVIHHMVMEHPDERDNEYVGKILIDPKYKGINQRHSSMGLKICKYRLTK